MRVFVKHATGDRKSLILPMTITKGETEIAVDRIDRALDDAKEVVNGRV